MVADGKVDTFTAKASVDVDRSRIEHYEVRLVWYKSLRHEEQWLSH